MIITQYTITCDHDGCPFKIGPVEEIPHSLFQLAHEHGWITPTRPGPGGTLHIEFYCALHHADGRKGP